MQDISLTLNIDDVNVILEGLGNLPFAKVYALIGKIQGQAADQLRAAAPNGAPRDTSERALASA